MNLQLNPLLFRLFMTRRGRKFHICNKFKSDSVDISNLIVETENFPSIKTINKSYHSIT